MPSERQQSRVSRFIEGTKRMIGINEQPKSSNNVYEGKSCPHCRMPLSETALKDKDSEIVKRSKHCGWCGWSPSREPHSSPEEARERAQKTGMAFQHLAERAEERGLR